MGLQIYKGKTMTQNFSFIASSL
jgi:hypothetical protein